MPGHVASQPATHEEPHSTHALPAHARLPPTPSPRGPPPPPYTQINKKTTPHPYPQVLALAAVARYLLAVKRQADSEAAHPSPPAAPWALGDSKRLWHAHARTYAMEHPEGRPATQQQQQQPQKGGEAGAGGRVSVELVVKGKADFEVRRIWAWSAALEHAPHL